jgi:hypothetical protein
MTEKNEAARVGLSADGEDGSAALRSMKQKTAVRPSRSAYSSEGAVGVMFVGVEPDVEEPAISSGTVGGSSPRRVECRGRPTPRPAAGKVEQQFHKLIGQFKRAFTR